MGSAAVRHDLVVLVFPVLTTPQHTKHVCYSLPFLCLCSAIAVLAMTIPVLLGSNLHISYKIRLECCLPWFFLVSSSLPLPLLEGSLPCLHSFEDFIHRSHSVLLIIFICKEASGGHDPCMYNLLVYPPQHLAWCLAH